MAKPIDFFNFGFPEQTTFLKNGLIKKTSQEHWALLECSKVNGLFTQQEPERNKLAATYEAENIHMAFQHASDMGEWKKYLQDHPPSPEALAVLILVAVGRAHSERAALAGKGKGATGRKKIADAIANQGDKTPKQVKMDLVEQEIGLRTVETHSAGQLVKKRKP
jgi:hypothetical protein